MALDWRTRTRWAASLLLSGSLRSPVHFEVSAMRCPRYCSAGHFGLAVTPLAIEARGASLSPLRFETIRL